MLPHGLQATLPLLFEPLPMDMLLRCYCKTLYESRDFLGVSIWEEHCDHLLQNARLFWRLNCDKALPRLEKVNDLGYGFPNCWGTVCWATAVACDPPSSYFKAECACKTTNVDAVSICRWFLKSLFGNFLGTFFPWAAPKESLEFREALAEMLGGGSQSLWPVGSPSSRLKRSLLEIG